MANEGSPANRSLSGAQILARLLALGAGALAFPDNVFAIVGSSDATKIAAFEVDGFTTGTTRTFTLPNASITVAGINLAQTFSATQTFAGIDATSIGATTSGTGQFTTLAASGVTTITNSTAATSISAGGALVLTAAGIRVATGSSFFGGALAVERAAAGNAVFTGKVTGDATNRFQAVVSGVISWGDGTSGVDTNLFRDAADTLKTSDSFLVSLGFGLGVTATATAAGTTTLVVGSTAVQTFTGSTTQTIQFPAANARGAGIAILYIINNQSSGTVTPTRAGSDTFQGGGTTDAVLAGATTRYLSDGVSVWLKV